MAAPSTGEEPRYGWVMVAIAPAFLALGNGGLGAISVFIKPLSAEFGWLRGETSFAYLAATLGSGVGGIAMGILADRFSTRHIILLGAIAGGLSFVGLSFLSSLWQFYLYYIVFGLLASAAFFAPLLSNVGAWFTARRGLAIGLVTAGQALGQGMVPYITALLIVGFGWQGAYTGLAIVFLAVLLPMSFLVRDAPGSGSAIRARARAGEAGEAAEDFLIRPRHSLAVLSAAAVFCCITMATPLIHAPALASDRGLSPENAARVLLIMLISGALGRVAFGRLADKIGGLHSYMAASLWQTVLVYPFVLVSTPMGFYTMAAVYGFGYAGVMTSLINSALAFSPKAHAGFATAVVALFGWVGMGLGAWQAGFLFDLTGDYKVPFYIAAYSGVVNLWLLGAIRIWQRNRRLALAG